MSEPNIDDKNNDRRTPTIERRPHQPPTDHAVTVPPGSGATAENVRSATGGRVWLVWGLLSGFLAGIAFMALNCWFAVTAGNDALAPFRTVATIVQGPPPESAAVWLGMVVHSLLAAVLGLLFTALLVPIRRRSAGWLIWAGLIFGAAVYIVDFQVLARAVPRFSAFPQATNQPFELAAHLVFGAVLAALVLLAKPRTARP
jgi:hypothetical protein